MKSIDFSIVICTRNRVQELTACLNSIAMQTYPPYEVIVVDSSDNYFSKTACKNWACESKVIVNYIQTRPGLTKQRNSGIRETHGDVVAFLDDDVILDKNYFRKMAECFNRFPALGGATGYITNLEQETWAMMALRNFFMLTSSGKEGVMKRSGFADFTDPSIADDVAPTEVLSGCNMLYRKEILDEFEFDEIFEGYSAMEDVEFSHRVSKKYALVFVREAMLIHERSKLERMNLMRSFEMAIYNHYYIFKKNVKTCLLDWVCFWWSHLGMGVQAVYWTIKIRRMEALRGYLLGHMRILKN